MREEPLTRDQVMQRFKLTSDQLDSAMSHFGFPAPAARSFTSKGTTVLVAT